ncbi:hypothetical protein HK102_005359 [Quaeritorhiza haematococci]|nr:hypothetical protein HK102_005359 [Quaeritorhiza haematococci]
MPHAKHLILAIFVALLCASLASAGPAEQTVSEAIRNVSQTVSDVSRQITGANPNQAPAPPRPAATSVPDVVNGAIQDITKTVGDVASNIINAPQPGASGTAAKPNGSNGGQTAGQAGSSQELSQTSGVSKGLDFGGSVVGLVILSLLFQWL